MKSPKFRLRSRNLSAVVTPAAIKRVWKDTVRQAMRRQLIEDPIELYDIHLNISSVAETLASRLVNCEYAPERPKRVLVEKSKGLCRQLVVPHPYDCLVLQCLSDSPHPALKAQAPHPNAFYQPDRGMGNRPKLDYPVLSSPEISQLPPPVKRILVNTKKRLGLKEAGLTRIGWQTWAGLFAGMPLQPEHGAALIHASAEGWHVA
jgi:hypothetical protein